MNRLGDLIAAQAAARGRHLESSSLLVAPLGAVAYSFWNEYLRCKPPVVAQGN